MSKLVQLTVVYPFLYRLRFVTALPFAPFFAYALLGLKLVTNLSDSELATPFYTFLQFTSIFGDIHGSIA